MSRCTYDDHAALRASPEVWASATENERPWPGEPIVIAECRECRTTVAREVEQTAEVVA